jgi:replicative DNA helicase
MADPRMGLPRSEEAELSLMGAFLRDGHLVRCCSLAVADFYSERHRAIFEAMHGLGVEETHVNMVSVCERLRRDRTLEMAGGEVYLMDIADRCVSTAGWESYEKLIAEKAKLRSLILMARQVNEQAFDDSKPVEEIIGNASNALGMLSHRDSPGRGHFSKYSREMIANPGARYERALKTGMNFLDRRLMMLPGDLGILAGRPGQGKTAFASQIAGFVSGSQEVVFNTLEMRPEELVERITCQMARVSSHAMKAPGIRLGPNDQQRVVELGHKLDLMFDDSPTVQQLRSFCLSRKAHGRLGLVVVDYLQLMEDERAENRTNEGSMITRGLKKLAGELDVPILALSQFSRGADKEEPRLSHLRESGSIEQDANWVLFVYDDPDFDGGKIVSCAKYRNGPVFGKLKVGWRGEMMRFEEPNECFEE